MERVLDVHLSGQYGLTNKIRDALLEVRHQFVYIGFLLDEAERLEYYREGGYESIYEYCEAAFGFKKSSTNNFIRVYRTFGEYMGLQEKYRDYNYSQLTEMCSMSPKDLAKCKPDMTVADIRLLKKGEVFQTSGKEVEIYEVEHEDNMSIDERVIFERSVVRMTARQLCDLWLLASDDLGPMDLIDIQQPFDFKQSVSWSVYSKGD